MFESINDFMIKKNFAVFRMDVPYRAQSRSSVLYNFTIHHFFRRANIFFKKSIKIRSISKKLDLKLSLYQKMK